MSFDLAWAAGFFDGEGNVSSKMRERNGYVTSTLTFQVAQAGVDCPEVLIRFNRAIGGLATIGGPYLRANPRHKPVWILHASSYQCVSAIYDMLRPWLGEIKRAQFEAGLRNRAAGPGRGRPGIARAA